MGSRGGTDGGSPCALGSRGGHSGAGPGVRGETDEGRGRVVEVSPLAGRPAPAAMLVNVPRLVSAYYTGRPDPAARAQRVVFGTSGHRGSALDGSFNEAHILAVTQAICRFRKQHGITGPLFL